MAPYNTFPTIQIGKELSKHSSVSDTNICLCLVVKSSKKWVVKYWNLCLPIVPLSIIIYFFFLKQK